MIETLSVLLIIALILLIIMWRNSNILKAKYEQLNIVADNKTKESERDNSIINELSKDLDNQSQTINNFKIKYSSILNIEELTEAKRSEYNNSLELLKELNKKYIGALEIYKSLEDELQIYQNDLDLIKYGLYKPQYDYFTSEEYKQKIEYNYLKQKECIVTDKAAICHTEWTISGSKQDGRKMTALYKKLMLFAFNGECDALIAKLKWNTATRAIEKLNKSFDTINKLGIVANVELTREYLKLKLDELALTHEYENKRQDEKEEQRRIRESMREEEKALRDFEIARKEAEEEEKRYQKALSRVKEDLKYASKDEVDSLNGKVAELEHKLKEVEEKRERAVSMAQQTKVGHIYIISNIGSFGEDIYKIGMTRRLEPLDRVKELSDAAVPFRYDVHAVIFSENAPQLENELHKHFHSRRINKVNGRKEFFKVSLNEIAEYVNLQSNSVIEFTLMAEAREYRETLTMVEQLLKMETVEEVINEQKYPTTLI